MSITAMKQHITHFNDCGCLSERKDAEIAALAARVAELEHTLRCVMEARQTAVESLAAAEAERDRLREALINILDGLAKMKTSAAMTSAEWDSVEAAVRKFPSVLDTARTALRQGEEKV